MQGNFGKLLRHHRQNHGLSQRQLRGELLELGYEIWSNGTVSKWESGKNTPRPDIIEALEDVLSLGRGTLLRPAGHPVEVGEAIPAEQASQIDPIILKRREAHFDHLAKISDELVARLDDVKAFLRPEGEFEYAIGGQGVTREQLSGVLDENIERAGYVFGEDDVHIFLCHLPAEYPDIESEGLQKVIEDNPFELIKTLKLLARRATFKGTCPVCQDW